MKDERNEQAKRIGWVSLVVDVAVSSHFAHFMASMLESSKRLARSLRTLTSATAIAAASSLSFASLASFSRSDICLNSLLMFLLKLAVSSATCLAFSSWESLCFASFS